MSCRMYSWLKSSHCWPIRWAGRERLTLSIRIQERSKAVFYTTHPIIHKLIHRACGLCCLDHQSELFMCLSVGGKRKEKEIASQKWLWTEWGKKSGVKKTSKQQLEEISLWLVRTKVQRRKSSLYPPPPFCQVGEQVWSERSVAVPDGRGDGREGCLTSTGDGFKKKNRIYVFVRQEMHM